MKNKALNIFFLLVIYLTSGKAQQNNSQDAKIPTKQKLDFVNKQFFIENKGQWHSDVLYLTRMKGLDAWITKKGINYTFYCLDEATQNSQEEKKYCLSNEFGRHDFTITGHRVLMNLQGINTHTQVKTEGNQKQEGYYNYLIGNDPSKHSSNVGLYKEILVKDVYLGVDMRYYFDNGLLRYDYVIHPGADPNQIQFKFEGSEKTYLNQNGELVFKTRFGEVKNAELYVYQKHDKKQIAAKFKKQNENFTIALETYNKKEILIIDPLIYSTYLGGGNYENVTSMALDSYNNVYITGNTDSPDYDVTVGAFQTNKAAMFDVFISKLNSAGTALIYSTFIGGNNDDMSNSITIDSFDNVYITGYSRSSDYDVTVGAFQTIQEGFYGNAFVTKLNSVGTTLIYSTFIGGSVFDEGKSIAVDAAGNVYVTGFAESTNFDVTPGAFQTSYAGGDQDVFVAKLNATGAALIYSTLIGGSDADQPYSIAVDNLGNAYITGFTRSLNYDVTIGAFNTIFRGGYGDAFVSKLNSSGSGLVYSTLIGGNSSEIPKSIAIDALGNAYITGYTWSTNYNVTPGAFQTTNVGGGEDIFVTKLNAAGSALIYSTYIGGSDDDEARSIAIDVSGNAYITGYTYSTNYDVTLGAFQTTNAGGDDALISKLNATGTALVYSTYIGGAMAEGAFGLVLDVSGSVYISGTTNSSDYDVTAGAFQIVSGGGYDNFITKLDMPLITNITESITSNLFNLFPNPSQGIYNITLQNELINYVVSIEVYDLQGKLIQSKYFDSKNSINIDISNEPAGIYMLKVKANSNYELLRLVKL